MVTNEKPRQAAFRHPDLFGAASACIDFINRFLCSGGLGLADLSFLPAWVGFLADIAPRTARNGFCSKFVVLGKIRIDFVWGHFWAIFFERGTAHGEIGVAIRRTPHHTPTASPRCPRSGVPCRSPRSSALTSRATPLCAGFVSRAPPRTSRRRQLGLTSPSPPTPGTIHVAALWEEMCNFLRNGNRSFRGSRRPRGPRGPFRWAGGPCPHLFEVSPGPPGPPRPPK